MVSFTSITQGVLFVSVMLLSLSEAAPATAHSSTVPHINGTTVNKSFTPPPLIASRVQPPTKILGDTNAEANNIAKNKQWYKEHGGNLTVLGKRDTTTVSGMTLDLPSSGVPPETATSSSTVVTATAAQVSNFKFYAGVASTAYCSSVVPNNQWSCEYCKTYVPDGQLVVTFSTSVGNINGYVLRSDAQKTIYLAFRGSSSFKNWIVNLVFDLTNYTPVSGAKVHQGFYTAYKEAQPYFFNQLLAQHNAYPSYKVVVTGHSLGGAEALLAGMDLYQRISTLDKSSLFIYTVGCPRVGNPTFANYVENTGITFSRSVNNRDIVPHVPPESFGYLHPGVEAWDLSYTNVQICTADIETNLCSDTIVPFTSISDHLTYYGLSEGTCV